MNSNQPDKLPEARLHVWVSGRVQAVGFRAYVAQNAAFSGVTGWARNVSYDTVEVVAEGGRKQLDGFLLAVKRGPHGSFIQDARVEWEPATGEFARFEVRRSL